MTLVVLGLDALDAAQVEYFGLDTLALETNAEIETLAYERDSPYTLQVWPSVATGVTPPEHGVAAGGESEWDNPVVDFASRLIAPHVGMQMRSELGDIVESVTGSEWSIAETTKPTFLDGDGRFVHNWPGVVNSHYVQRIWQEIDYTASNDIPQEDFDREIWALAAEQFGWLRELLDHDAALIASHVHILDPSGHAYAANEDHYRGFYEKTEAYVAELLERMGPDDELLVVSDHGMQTTWLDDESPSDHSWRAYAASTTDTVPGSVLEVRDWVEEHVAAHNERYEERDRTDLELPEETLRDLGYIE